MNSSELYTEDMLKRVRVGIDLPSAMVAKLDREAKRRGVTRQALIKVWVSDRLTTRLKHER